MAGRSASSASPVTRSRTTTTGRTRQASVVPYGDAAALEAAIDETTVAVLLEPVQGEAGVIPPSGYLAAVRAACTRNNVLMIADEIQSGLGRAGATFASERAGVVPDVYILGKALGGGIVALLLNLARGVLDLSAPALVPAARLISAISALETVLSTVTTTLPVLASVAQAVPGTSALSTAALALLSWAALNV